MIIDHESRYISISIPKTASISLQFSLGHGNNIPEPDEYHQGISSVLEKYPQCAHYFKFSFVRNPWARLLSLYNDFTLKRIYQYSGKVRHDKPLLSEFTDFNDLCIRLPESPWSKNIFFASQSSLLSINDKIAMNYVGRFETLESDFNRICAIIGKPGIELQKRNTGNYDNLNYRKYYTKESQDAIAKHYKVDIERFGYEF